MLQYLSSLIRKYFLVFLLVNLPFVLNAQNVDDEIESREENEIISFSDISKESESLNLRLFDYRITLEPSANVRRIDSLLKLSNREIIKGKDSIIEDFKDISQRNLKILRIDWNDRRSELKTHQNKLNSRSKVIADINTELVDEIKKWELTKNTYSGVSENKEIYDNFDKIIAALDNVIEMTTVRLEKIYVVEKKLTELVLFTDEIIAEIDNKEIELRKDYFIFDSDPIWKLSLSKSKKEIGNNTGIEGNGFSSPISNNLTQVFNFLENNVRVFSFQLIFILSLLILLILVKKRWRVDLEDLSNPVDIQSKIILKHYISATVVVGFLVSAFFYDELIPVIAEFHVILVFLGTIILLPKLTNQKFSFFLLILFGLYLLSIVSSYADEETLLFRGLLIVEIALLLYGLKLGKEVMISDVKKFDRLYKPFVILVPIYSFFLVVSFLANIIGMVSLSIFLNKAVLASNIILMIIYLSVLIVSSILVLIFKLRKSYGINAVSTIVQATHRRIQPILFWYGMFVWFYISLRQFSVLDYFATWVDRILHINWEVGEMSISFGGILSFLGIFVITLFVAKLIASILQDDWLLKMLPKGVAPAISLLLRIVIVTIGFYIGLRAAGINLSQLGFILGALGVGIGFGLQNVVLNFIAGLILAFERPISIGDTVVVDSEFGVVTNIGIRSSNIKTYDGYEAIIPNGDLISKKVINWTLSNNDRRTKIFLKTAPNAEPKEVIILFNNIAKKHINTYEDPVPFTYFKGFSDDGNLLFELWYWTTISHALSTKHEISLLIFEKLRQEGINAPAPVRKILKND